MMLPELALDDADGFEEVVFAMKALTDDGLALMADLDQLKDRSGCLRVQAKLDQFVGRLNDVDEKARQVAMGLSAGNSTAWSIAQAIGWLRRWFRVDYFRVKEGEE